MALSKTSSSSEQSETESEKPVEEFLTRFIEATTSGDAKAAAAMWEVPAFAIGDEIGKFVNTPEEMEGFFAGAKDEYNKKGIVGSRPEIKRLEWVSDRIAIVSVRWPYLDAKGNEVGAETSTYTLREDDAGELKFRIAVMHGEEKVSKVNAPPPKD